MNVQREHQLSSNQAMMMKVYHIVDLLNVLMGMEHFIVVQQDTELIPIYQHLLMELMKLISPSVLVRVQGISPQNRTFIFDTMHLGAPSAQARIPQPYPRDLQTVLFQILPHSHLLVSCFTQTNFLLNRC